MAWNEEPGTTPTEEQEFDRLFALDDPDSDTGAQGSTQQTPPAQAAGGETGQENTGGQAAPGTGEGQSGDKSDAQPGATGTTTEAQAEADWLDAADLPDDVKDRIKADRAVRDQAAKDAEDRFKALHGKVAPTQQQLAEARSRIAQLEQRQVQQPAPAATTQPASQAQENADYFASEGFKRYEQMFPDDAKVLREAIEARTGSMQQALQQMEARVGQIAQRLESTEQVTSRTAIAAERDKLAEAHPDWSELNASDEFWGWFDQWRASQPKSLRGMYYDKDRLTDLWNDSEFAIGMIDIYKAQHQPAAAAATTTATTTQPDSTTQQQPAQAAPAQNARVAMSVQPQVRGGAALPQASSMEGLSEAEQFEQLWKQTD